MKVRISDMDKNVRAAGVLMKLFVPSFNEKRFATVNKLTNKFLKGKWLGKKTQMVEKTIPRKDGSPMRIVIVTSKKGTVDHATGMLWSHGGGYACGCPEQEFAFLDRFCGDGKCVAIVPDYRTSVEAPYPAALDDCYSALLWLKNNADQMKINKNQIFLGGDSAGGGLTAALSLYARDRGEVQIAYQMPLYPMLDYRMITNSARDNNAPAWDSKSNEIAWKMYLRGIKEPEVPAYASPALAEDYSNLPPTLTLAGTLEPFYDETVAYVEALRIAGVSVDFKEFVGCFHAIDYMGEKNPTSKRAIDFEMAGFRYAQANYFAENR